MSTKNAQLSTEQEEQQSLPDYQKEQLQAYGEEDELFKVMERFIYLVTHIAQLKDK